MKKMLFIVNPYSGQAKAKSRLCDMVDVFIKCGYEVTVHLTQAPLDAKKKAKNHGGKYDRVVCSGGDGTLDEVVSGLLESGIEVPLGYIPAGSTNDFSKSLKIPSDMKKAALTAVKGVPKKFDVGRINDRDFVYVAAFGAFTEITYKTPQEVKNLLGYTAYVVEGAKSLKDIKASHMTIRYDGNCLEGDFLVGMVSNSISVAGIQLPFMKETLLDDGMFEVLLVRMPLNLIDLQNVLGDLLTGKVNSKYVHFFRAHAIEMTSDQNIAWTVDGEYGGTYQEALIENRQQAICLVTK